MSYYTPSIEEFYVGFEYEQMFKIEESIIPEEVGQPMWVRQTCKKDDFNKVTNPIMAKYLRVKHLDKSDIVSLGWEFVNGLKGLTEYYSSQYINRIYEEDGYMYWEVFLKYNVDLKRVTITANISDGSVEEKFFEGSCRNKSELSKIMKFLNIKLTR